MNEQRNMILAAALSMLVIIGWQYLLPAPPAPDPADAPQAAAPGAQTPAPGAQALAPAPGPAAEAAPAPALTREAALAETARLVIDTPALDGSISLRGGRIDDLRLKQYRQTIDPNSPEVTLLSPAGSEQPYYAVWGWIPAAGAQTGPTPGPETEWRVESGATLAPGADVALIWDNGAGLTFRRVFSVDEHFMFTVTQSVENGAGEALSLSPYGIVARIGQPETTGMYILHEGAVAEVDGVLVEHDYDDLLELEHDPNERAGAERIGVAQSGWLGFTGKYWMAVMAGGPQTSFTGVFKAAQTASGPVFQTDLRREVLSVAPGRTASATQYFFAGAKQVSLLKAYRDSLGIEGFDDAVDWGWFFFLTKPIFQLLMLIKGVLGNMGWSIVALTFVIKAILFPLAYKSFVSMSRMKKLQPEMEKIKERAGDDKMAIQQEMMALYKKEKVNPAAGCLPILMQIPIFFSLYKVIFVTLELRHAPFIWWIKDLSAPDPSSWINLFGALPWAGDTLPGLLAFLSIGLFPILMGVSMWMQQKLNPAPADPVQQQIFALMPWMFMFMLGRFASGLVIYWLSNNILTFAQQYTIMRSQGVEVDFFGNVKRSFKRKKKAEKK